MIPLEKRNVSKARREKIIAAQNGVCKRACCEAPATDVDHIIPLWVGGSNRDDNLEGLCFPCHQRKTKAEASARAKAKRIEARINGNRRPRKPIPQRVNPWPPKGSRKLPSKRLKAQPTAVPSHGGCADAASVEANQNPTQGASL